MPSAFDALGVVRRDLQRHEATCNADPLAAHAVHSAARPDRLARVLVIDAACLCRNNGIGNLYGDYAVAFAAAALANRTLYIDWSGTARRAPPFAEDMGNATVASLCQDPRHGPVCGFLRGRFDLGHFFGAGVRGATPGAAPGVAPWLYTPRVRAALGARHGLGAERRIRTTVSGRRRTSCVAWAEALASPSIAWLTAGVDDWSGGLFPNCGAGGSGPDADRGLFGEGWHLLLRRLLEAMAPQLEADGAAAAAARARSIAAEFRGSWNVAISLSMGLNSDALAPGAAAALLGAPRHGLGLVFSCAMHHMLRPLPKMQRRLAALLGAADAARDAGPIVTLQLRSGWAEEAHEQARVAEAEAPTLLSAEARWRQITGADVPEAERCGDRVGGASRYRPGRCFRNPLGAWHDDATWARVAAAAAAARGGSGEPSPPPPRRAAVRRALNASTTRHLEVFAATSAPVAAALQCAIGLARTLALERPPHRADDWRLYLATDSAALAATVAQLPGLGGRVVYQGGGRRSSAAGGRRRLSDDMYRGVPLLKGMSLAMDVWMLGAADHTLAASSSTLTNWATRSVALATGEPHWQQPRGGRWMHAANKVIPVCHERADACLLKPKPEPSCPCDALVYQPHTVQAATRPAWERCRAKRRRLFGVDLGIEAQAAAVSHPRGV